ncbi:hypothetical protein SAMN04488021_14238 [Paracoccus aminovorans]|uniref:Uncharacterized protein n=1 Tax=Paracoccus aminovorans TaxID=34004 RepID=A0A1I3DVE3_9RHOB|nr:hypothetical protein [Paracoccus aminovorans]CQR86911.1 hypothetical protein JCM7685_2359 [Paracoccus aminovorans]SFH90675.1 hypothetical protein SAMN04488021_14238 [Paracoccus aminovorans]
MRRSTSILKVLAATGTVLAGVSALAQQTEPLAIREQGSFFAGGSVARTRGTYDNNAPSAEGQSIHGDHLYAFYQIP